LAWHLPLLLGSVVRGRGFLRAAYAAADAGYELEAMVHVRCMNEWAITMRWMILDPDYHSWLIGIADLNKRLAMDTEVRALPGGVAILEDKSRARDEARLAELKAECGDRDKKLPNVYCRAKKARLRWLYAMAYRADSQVAVHPTIWGLEPFTTADPEGRGLILHECPPATRRVTSPYKAALVPFAIILTTFAQKAEDTELEAAIHEVTQRLPGGVGTWQALCDDEAEAEGEAEGEA
jgi:hypothetical protein